MSSESSETTSPFVRPRFITAAVLVGAIVVLAVVLAIVNASRGDGGPSAAPTSAAPSATATDEASPPTPAREAEASVCGLRGEKSEGRLTSAPDVDEWQYQGTTAFPVSTKYGPSANDPAGFRYCFQRSPEGAVFAAASAVAGANSMSAWAEYWVSAEVPDRESLVARAGASPAGDSATRTEIRGFRLLAYDGDSARVDLGSRATASGNTIYASTVINLVWEGGDWKLLPEDAENPIPLTTLPDLSGYIPWGE